MTDLTGKILKGPMSGMPILIIRKVPTGYDAAYLRLTNTTGVTSRAEVGKIYQVAGGSQIVEEEILFDESELTDEEHALAMRLLLIGDGDV